MSALSMNISFFIYLFFSVFFLFFFFCAFSLVWQCGFLCAKLWYYVFLGEANADYHLHRQWGPLNWTELSVCLCVRTCLPEHIMEEGARGLSVPAPYRWNLVGTLCWAPIALYIVCVFTENYLNLFLSHVYLVVIICGFYLYTKA